MQPENQRNTTPLDSAKSELGRWFLENRPASWVGIFVKGGSVVVMVLSESAAEEDGLAEQIRNIAEKHNVPTKMMEASRPIRENG